MHILYEQTTGFSDINVQDWWLEGEAADDHVARLKLKTIIATSDYSQDAWEWIAVFERADGEYPLIAEVSYGDRIDTIFFRTRADFVAYWHHFGAARAAMMNSQITDMHGMLTKLFRAMHGHDPEGICRQCDPNEWKTTEKNDRMRSAARAKGWDPKQYKVSLADFMLAHEMKESDF